MTDEATSTKTTPAVKKSQVKLSKVTALAKRMVVSRVFYTAVFIIAALLPTLYFYNKSQRSERLLKNPDATNKLVVDEFVKKVGKHIVLPTDEQPTLASVSDIEKIKDQPFFAKAQNGDKVLIYTQSRKAILYRPDLDILVDVAPLNINSIDGQNGIKK